MMKGFIIYPSYKNIGGKSHVVLYGRLENGESFVALKPYTPHFFIREKDTKKLKKANFEDTNLKNFKGEPVKKIIFSNPFELMLFLI